ncbi:MAG: hypothetical protein AB7O52_04110 [Planctomycetota bacterium]
MPCPRRLERGLWPGLTKERLSPRGTFISKLRPRQPARRRCRLRRVKPGVAYLITKKTSDNLFWLKASPEMNALLLYTLILWARRYGALIHVFCFISNHVHLLVTDVR